MLAALEAQIAKKEDRARLRGWFKSLAATFAAVAVAVGLAGGLTTTANLTNGHEVRKATNYTMRPHFFRRLMTLLRAALQQIAASPRRLRRRWRPTTSHRFPMAEVRLAVVA